VIKRCVVKAGTIRAAGNLCFYHKSECFRQSIDELCVAGKFRGGKLAHTSQVITVLESAVALSAQVEGMDHRWLGMKCYAHDRF
jgi:hypothetical protein